MAGNDTSPIDTGTTHRHAEARHRLVVVWTWVGAILLAAVGLYLTSLLSIAVGIVIWTVVFVFILSGPVNFFQKHGIRRTIGTTLAFLLFVAVIGLLLFIMFSPIFGVDTQFAELAKAVPGYVETMNQRFTDFYNNHTDIFENATVKGWIDDASNGAAKMLQDVASSGASGMVAFGTSIANIGLCVGFAFVVSFWMLIELPNLGKEARRLIGEKHMDSADMFYITITRVMSGYLRTTLIQCAVIGILCGILFAILGVPSPAAFGVITGLMNIIPIIGPWIGGALAFIPAFIKSPLIGIIALIGVVIIQQAVYTFLSPKLMGDSVDIHPALTFIALMAGSAIGGAMGGIVGALVGTLLSIPLVAVFKSMFVYYFEKRTGRCIVAEDGVFFKGKPHTLKNGQVDPVADATGPIVFKDPQLKNAQEELEKHQATAEGVTSESDTTDRKRNNLADSLPQIDEKRND